MTKSDSYKKGYRIGRRWKNDWTPGGPYFCNDETRKANKEWREGWRNGVRTSKYRHTHPAVAALIISLDK